jgi:nicotinamidase-related amidase
MFAGIGFQSSSKLVWPLLLSLAAVFPSRSGAIYSGKTRLHLRTRIQPFQDKQSATEVHFDESIDWSHTAIIITDMWDRHWCHGAPRRVEAIAVRMEPLIEQARRQGILIIHAPSDTMSFYKDAPGRLLAEQAPQAEPPPERKIVDGPLPINDSDGGCDTPGDHEHRVWTRETPILHIAPGDIISDSGTEIYNVLHARHIDTLLFMGVHANMCILNRSFGIRQMSRWGMRCILVRDLTDAMYNPASPPYVSHAQGTEMVIEFIEQYWAPTTTSTDLLSALHTSGAN